MDNKEKLWQLYSANKAPEVKEQLILAYAHLVKFVAGRLAMQVGQHVEFDDLIGDGIFGLLDAIDRFDPDKGVKFETYASLRIRGSILDSIRKRDWVPRTLRQKNRMLEQAYAQLEDQLGREPTDTELADKLALSLEETQELLRKTSVLALVSLDDFLDQNYETANNGLTVSQHESPELKAEKNERRKILAEAIDKLSEKEKLVVSLYYYDDLTLKEISSIMQVTESRVSQIHSKAILKLNAKLGNLKALLIT